MKCTPAERELWRTFVASLRFKYPHPGTVEVEWSAPAPGCGRFDISAAQFYGRNKVANGNGADRVQAANARLFRDAVAKIAQDAGVRQGLAAPPPGSYSSDVAAEERFAAEEHFHDQWASAEQVAAIDVRLRNEACTAPEMRYIRQVVGSLAGKSLLDVGCGLGEASVYFALEGADVMATDISQRMLDATVALADRYGVRLRVHKTAAERFELPAGQQFDVIYAGNLFHHVDIGPTLQNLLRFLKPSGMLVSWDPVAYNPLINLYRRMATDVRTKDEHPLRLRDLAIFGHHFGEVRSKWFWLTTLAIFIIMATVQRRNPNKERYWKAVVSESARWKWLYTPLERLDRLLLGIAPFLGPLCWNVVVVATKPKLEGVP